MWPLQNIWTLMFRSFHFSFLVFDHFWQRSYENITYLCLYFARQDGQDGKNQKGINATKIPKTKNMVGWTKQISRLYTTSYMQNKNTWHSTFCHFFIMDHSLQRQTCFVNFTFFAWSTIKWYFEIIGGNQFLVKVHVCTFWKGNNNFWKSSTLNLTY